MRGYPPRSSAWIPAGLVLLACCDGRALAGPETTPLQPEFDVTTAARPAGSVPWRIRATVATTPAPPPAGCLLYFTSVIEGHATHLGAFSGVGSTCVTGLIQPDPDPPLLPAGPPPYLTADFHNPLWTLTAANGDQIWLENVDAVFVISLADNSSRGEARQRIIGGTGRFAGATGEAMVGGVNEDGQGPDDFAGSGWIRYDASNRGRR